MDNSTFWWLFLVLTLGSLYLSSLSEREIPPPRDKTQFELDCEKYYADKFNELFE